MQVRSLGWEPILEEEMATHSSIFARIVPWTGAFWASLWDFKDSDMTEPLST